MNLRQLNLSFVPREDRVLLKVSSDAGEEVRCWWTRRLVSMAWPQLLKLMETAPTKSAAASKTPLEFRHAAAVESADFATPYEEAEKKSVIEGEPLLISKLSLAPTADLGCEMVLIADGRPTVTLNLPPSMLHGLVKLLQDAVQSANWALALELPSAPMASHAIN